MVSLLIAWVFNISHFCYSTGNHNRIREVARNLQPARARLDPLPHAPPRTSRRAPSRDHQELADRIAEARINGWLGEVEGLQASLVAVRGKLAALDRTARNAVGATDLGMPTRRPVRQEMP